MHRTCWKSTEWKVVSRSHFESDFPSEKISLFTYIGYTTKIIFLLFTAPRSGLVLANILQNETPDIGFTKARSHTNHWVWLWFQIWWYLCWVLLFIVIRGVREKFQETLKKYLLQKWICFLQSNLKHLNYYIVSDSCDYSVNSSLMSNWHPSSLILVIGNIESHWVLDPSNIMHRVTSSFCKILPKVDQSLFLRNSDLLRRRIFSVVSKHQGSRETVDCLTKSNENFTNCMKLFWCDIPVDDLPKRWTFSTDLCHFLKHLKHFQILD